MGGLALKRIEWSKCDHGQPEHTEGGFWWKRHGVVCRDEMRVKGISALGSGCIDKGGGVAYQYAQAIIGESESLRVAEAICV